MPAGFQIHADRQNNNLEGRKHEDKETERLRKQRNRGHAMELLQEVMEGSSQSLIKSVLQKYPSYLREEQQSEGLARIQ